MKVLITGSQGFVGKELSKELQKKHAIREFDLAKGNDLLNHGHCAEAVKGIEIVFHLAAVLDEDSPLLYNVNVLGTKNILDAAAKEHVKQFVFLSSVGVHGKLKEEINEASKIAPETKYEKTKAEAEKLVLDSQEMLPVTVIRAALVMGANNYWKNILKFIKKDFPLPGRGKNTFQTIFINDLVSALDFTANNPDCMGETFIVAQKEKPSLIETCQRFRRELGMKGECKTISLAVGKTIASLNLVKNKLVGKKSLLEPAYVNRLQHERNYNTKKINGLGWKPKYSIEQAVKETVRKIQAGNEE